MTAIDRLSNYHVREQTEPLSIPLALAHDVFGDAIVVRTGAGFPLAIDLRAPDRGASVLLEPSYEPGLTALLERLLLPGRFVVDLGASVGYLTVLAGRAVTPDGTVLAWEANPAAFDLLRSNVRRNRLETVVRLIQAEPHDLTGTTAMRAGFGVALPVEARRLDDELPPGARIDVLLLDAGRFGRRALRGMRRVVHENPDAVYICTAVPRGAHDVVAELSSAFGATMTVHRVGTAGELTPREAGAGVGRPGERRTETLVFAGPARMAEFGEAGVVHRILPRSRVIRGSMDG